MENTSGRGKLAVVPEELKGWSWGAFSLNWIWGLGNGTYWALLCLIPYVGLIMAIVLGLKGNEWAWRNKHWQSVEQFKRIQGIWSKWGIGFFVGVIILFLIAVTVMLPKLTKMMDAG